MGFTGVRKLKTKPKGDIVTALDVGSSKVVCLIARIDGQGMAAVVGVGHQVSRGVRAGAIADMEAAETAIRHAVHSAEEMTGEHIRDVTVNLAGGAPASQIVFAEVPIVGGEVTDADLRRALKTHNSAVIPPDFQTIHAIPVSYSIDGSNGIRDPRGMYGERLGMDIHLVTAKATAVRNLATCINRGHLDIDAFVVSPYAAGLACLVDDERELGSAVIDMGGGSTSIGVFFEGRMVFADCIPVGGHHVTKDIARGLTTPIQDAERVKTLHGTAMAGIGDDREIIDVPQVGEEDPGHTVQVARSILTGIIQPRVEEIFELVRSRLEASGFDKVAGRRVVLTGGASQLTGIRDLAQQVLDKQVRLGRPQGLFSLSEQCSGPEFATVAGLLCYALRHQGELMLSSAELDPEPEDIAPGFLARVGGWFKENL
jgi:cell division protein FtsA